MKVRKLIMLIQLDKVSGSAYLENVVIPEAGVPNGALISVGTSGDYGTVNGVKIADVTSSIVMLVEEFMNRTGLENETDMTFTTGQIIRGYHLPKDSIITVTIDGVTNATNVSADMVGKFVIPVIGTYKPIISATASGSLCFQVRAIETLAGKDALVLRVV
jgi:hypothetical protein